MYINSEIFPITGAMEAPPLETQENWSPEKRMHPIKGHS